MGFHARSRAVTTGCAATDFVGSVRAFTTGTVAAGGVTRCACTGCTAVGLSRTGATGITAAGRTFTTGAAGRSRTDTLTALGFTRAV